MTETAFPSLPPGRALAVLVEIDRMLLGEAVSLQRAIGEALIEELPTARSGAVAERRVQRFLDALRDARNRLAPPGPGV